jgi:hypothetical protein
MLVAALSPGLGVLVLVSVGLSIWALVDAIGRPVWAFQAAGSNKTLWIVLEAVGFFVCGLVLSLIYLIAVRPKVAAAQRGVGAPPIGGGPAAGGPPAGSSPPGWYPDPSGAEQYRYWDGRVWTAETRPMM